MVSATGQRASKGDLLVTLSNQEGSARQDSVLKPSGPLA
jgi:hypothetical protein